MNNPLPPILPKGERHTDPPRQGLWYRAKLALAKYPVILGCTLALVVATVALVSVHNQQGRLVTQAQQLVKDKADNATLRQASFGFCHRLQIQRDRENRSAAVIYLTLESAAAREFALAKAHAPDTGVHFLSGRASRALAEQSEYTPPTDCVQAVDHPATYRNPAPVPYTRPLAVKVIPTAARILLGIASTSRR